MKGSDRYAAHEVSATCRCCGKLYPVMNLSLGGLFLASDAPPRPGEPVALDLRIPGRPAFRVAGLVAWNNDPERVHAPRLPRGFGVRVREIDLAGRLALIQHLRQHEASLINRG